MKRRDKGRKKEGYKQGNGVRGLRSWIPSKETAASGLGGTLGFQSEGLPSSGLQI